MVSSFDYVVVGAGSAGCVVASRLSEDLRARVLLLEAGPADRRQEIHIPAAWSKLFKSEVDWDYSTTPQPALGGRCVYWPRGRTLGGSSSINAQMYIRGHRADFDEWARLGASGWSFADVLPCFRRAERCARGADEYRGGSGPLYIEDGRAINPLSRRFLDACGEIGLSPNPDFNGAELDGAGLAQVTQRRGRRCSAADAYLRPARRRDNLVVVTEAPVRRILFDGNRAVGIAYTRRGAEAEQEVRVTREVILCAGAINSPQLLMLSGIGPADELQRHGIAVRRHLSAVGRNLEDHLVTGVFAPIGVPQSMFGVETLGNLLRYLLFRRGPLASNIGEAAAFIRTKSERPAPDIEIVFAPVLFLNEGLGPPPGHGVTFAVVLLRPESRGTISLAGPDPQAKPVIDPNYLADERDWETTLSGVRLAQRLAGTRAFAPILDGRPTPDSDDEVTLRSHIRDTAQTLYHPVGTCRIGGEDCQAVVDPTLRVHGVEGLRVVDASVMPRIIRGHTNAAAIMIGERGADLIRGFS